MERRRVVITGLGAVTPIGLTAAESWQAVKDGVCGIAPITQFDPTDLKVHLAAEVKGFVPENYMSKPEAKRMGRFTQMAVVSAKEALDGAGFTLDEAEADRCGVIVSSGIGGLSITEAEHGHLQHGRRPDRHPHRLPGHVLLSGDRLYRRHQCRRRCLPLYPGRLC